jgi:hypothetical protein
VASDGTFSAEDEMGVIRPASSTGHLSVREQLRLNNANPLLQPDAPEPAVAADGLLLEL